MATLPLGLILSLAALLLVGVVVAVLGRRIPRGGDWLVGVSLLAVVMIILLHWSGYLGEEASRGPLLGWVFGLADPRALRVGLVPDRLGLSLVVIVCVLCGAMILPLLGAAALDPRGPVVAAAAFGAIGSAVCWVSATPWSYFLGLSVLTLAGVLSFRAETGIREDGNSLEQFLRQRFWSVVFLLLGAAVWSSRGSDAEAGISPAALLFLLAGTGFLLRPVPGGGPGPLRLLVGQTLPSWAAFPLLFRYREEFIRLEIFPVAGRVALVLSLLVVLSGLFQDQRRRSMAFLQTSGLMIAFVAYFFAGNGPALSILFSVGVGVLGLSTLETLAQESLDRGAPERRVAAPWAARIPVLLAGAGISGGLGFLASSGFSISLGRVFMEAATLALLLLVYTLFALHAWRCVRFVEFKVVGAQLHAGPLLLPYGLAILLLGVLWQGYPMIGFLEDQGVRVFDSVFEKWLGMELSGMDGEQGLMVVAILQGALLLALSVAIWMTSGGQDRLQGVQDRFPSAVRFVSGGYGLPGVFVGALRALRVSGERLQWAFDRAFWSRFLRRSRRRL